MSKEAASSSTRSGETRSAVARIASSLAVMSMLSTSLNLTSSAPAVAARKIAAVSADLPRESQSTTPARHSGTLTAMLPSGKQIGLCPLTHTDVTADVSGYISRVKVKQIFENTNKETIDAVYTFPLSNTGAVDEMVMQIGNRRINGSIKKRSEAREIFNAAKAHGQTASLLDQERKNIFTQSVANIPAGAKVEITLQYVETLPFEDGKFSFTFPTVVGPRFIPGMPASEASTARAANTDQVPDASLITPLSAGEGRRAGHDIAIKVSVNGGVPISNISSKLHEVKVERDGENKAVISLVNQNTIPNKDFVLSWDVASDSIKSGCLTHRDKSDKSGYFTLMVMPPKRPTISQIAPKEMIFVVDCSGSQHGKPLQKAKETLSYIIDHMNPQDTFQIIAFNNGNNNLFEKPQSVSAAMKEKARHFINNLQANGATYAAPAIESACAIPADEHRLRVVTFMTDGYVGNDLEIIGLIRKLRGNSRWFTFGTGNSVNRALIDDMATEGGGEADYVLLNSSGAEVGKKFYQHISSPVLTDIKIDFGSLKVKDVSPREVFDVWAQRPLYFKGRYEQPGSSTVTISGYSAGKPYKQTLNVILPEKDERNSALGSIWARAQVDKLLREDFVGAQQNNMKKELQDEITAVALKHHIMTHFTSFVAVDEKSKVPEGQRTIEVPVEIPEGVSQMPQLQSATNGTIGVQAADATYLNARGAVAASPAPMPSLNAGRGMRFEFSPNVFAQESSKEKSLTIDAAKVDKAKKDIGQAHLARISPQSKLDISLSNLLKVLTSKKQLSQKIAISIKFKGDLKNLQKALQMLGFVQEKQDEKDGIIVGTISGEKIQEIEKFSSVLSVKLKGAQ